MLIQNDNTDDFSDTVLEGDELVIYETQETTQQIKTVTKKEIEKMINEAIPEEGKG